MKYSCLLALFLMPLVLQAKDKVTLKWIFVSCEEPLWPFFEAKQSNDAQSKAGVPAVWGTAGIFNQEQFEDALKKAQKNSATVRSLPPCLVNSGEKCERKNMETVPSSARLVGDTKRFSARNFKPDAVPENTSVGYRLTCTPAIGPDGRTLDVSVEIYFRLLKEYHEVLLSGDLATALTENQRDLSSEKYPRVASPIFETRRLATNVSLWDGQSVVFSSTGAENKARHDYIILTANVEK